MVEHRSCQPDGQKIETLEDDLILQQLEIEALRLAIDKYRDIFDNANDAIFIIDANHHFAEVNRKAVELFGYTKEEFLALKVTDLMPADQARRLRKDRKDSDHLIAAGHEKYVGRLRSKAGSWLDVEVSSSPILQQGKLLGFRDLVRDITGRKRVEAELSSYRDHLEELVAKRSVELLRYTRQLEEEIASRQLAEQEREQLVMQLQQKQKIEAIGVLAGGIAHDFNNILNTIMAYAELAQTSLSPADCTRDHLERIVQAVQRAGELVRQILHFSSRSQGQGRQPVRLQTLVKEEVKLIRGTLPDNIHMSLDICQECRPVLADFIQLHQVIMNLGTNAVNAMAESGGTLRVLLHEVELDEAQARQLGIPPQHCARLVFEDTGPGIPAESMARIFEPYFTTRKTGTGLGLATVQSIVHQLDGACQVTSQPGNGTTFAVFLPVVDRRVSPKPPAVEGIRQRAASILLVDDNLTLVASIRRQLLGAGYRVEGFIDPLRALAALRKDPQRFDLLITDQSMPGLTGLELTEAVLALRPGLPVLLISGLQEEGLEQRALQSGARQFMVKPVVIRELLPVIADLLQKGETAKKQEG